MWVHKKGDNLKIVKGQKSLNGFYYCQKRDQRVFKIHRFLMSFFNEVICEKNFEIIEKYHDWHKDRSLAISMFREDFNYLIGFGGFQKLKTKDGKINHVFISRSWSPYHSDWKDYSELFRLVDGYCIENKLKRLEVYYEEWKNGNKN